MTWLAIAAGGALGSLCRHIAGSWVQHAADTAFPIGTLAVNVAGSFLLGLIYGAMADTLADTPWKAFAAVGFCGGFTTFSTFSYDTAVLIDRGQVLTAGLNAGLSVTLSVAAMIAGMTLASAARR